MTAGRWHRRLSTTGNFAPQRFQKRLAQRPQLVLQPFGAITVLADPRLRTVVVPALSSIMRVLYAGELEILLPIGPLFAQGRRAVAHLHPAGRLVGAQPGVPHVSEVFAAGHGASAQNSALDGFQKG